MRAPNACCNFSRLRVSGKQLPAHVAKKELIITTLPCRRSLYRRTFSPFWFTSTTSVKYFFAGVSAFVPGVGGSWAASVTAVPRARIAAIVINVCLRLEVFIFVLLPARAGKSDCMELPKKEFGSEHSKRRAVAVQSLFRILRRRETWPAGGLARFPAREKPTHADLSSVSLLRRYDRLT